MSVLSDCYLQSKCPRFIFSETWGHCYLELPHWGSAYRQFARRLGPFSPIHLFVNRTPPCLLPYSITQQSNVAPLFHFPLGIREVGGSTVTASFPMPRTTCDSSADRAADVPCFQPGLCYRSAQGRELSLLGLGLNSTIYRACLSFNYRRHPPTRTPCAAQYVDESCLVSILLPY